MIADNLFNFTSSGVKRVEGYWQTITLRPDFASHEALNIGVIFNHNAQIKFRLLDSVDKFTRLYGEAAEDELQFLLRAIQGALRQNTLPQFPSISFGPQALARGDSVDEIVERLYATCVTLSGPAYRPQQERSKFINNTFVRNEVFRHIRLMAGLAAEQVIASDAEFLFKDNDRVIPLDIPLRHEQQLGTVVSAAFSSPENVERALLRAFFDLTTAMHISNSRSGSFFVFRPKELRPKVTQQKIDNVIEVTAWKVGKAGLKVDMSDSSEGMAEHILEWAHVR